jgi:amino acid adenylation domain-containing protein/non-ribosomal peptide synthase protein (TIGR01720 family)
MEIKKLLKRVRENNIDLSIKGDNLQLKSDKIGIPPVLHEEIKKHKEEIISYLRNNVSNKVDYETIPALPVQSDYELSSSQFRLWVLSQFKEANLAYNIPGVYVLEGSLNKELLAQSFTDLITRHEILHTVFRENTAGDIRQHIMPVSDLGFNLEYVDYRGIEDSSEQVMSCINRDSNHSFDLAVGPLLRATLYHIKNDKYVLVYVMHHIISDGWSMQLLINELILFYNAYIKGQSNHLIPLRIHYKDYAAWQQKQLSGDAFKVHKAYWLKQFEGELPILEFPSDKTRPAVKTYNGGVVSKQFNPSLSKGLKNLSQKQGGTLFMSLLAAINAVLYIYTKQEDFIIGTGVAGREHTDLEDQIGFYVNTLALRTRLKKEDSYEELLERIKQVTLEAYEHQGYPFDKLLDELQLQPDMSRNALFDVMVNLQNVKIDSSKQQNLDDIKISTYEESESTVSKFDLTFHFTETGEELLASIEYNSDIYSKAGISQLLKHLESLLNAVIKNPSTPIHQLNYLSEKDKHQLLVEFNDAVVEYSESKTIVDLFEEQVLKSPNNTALVFEGIEITYKELNEKSNQLANYLRKNYNVQADDLIGIMLDRSEKMIISILGIIKSGGAYVPIDPDYPQARKEYIIKNTGIKALITQTDYIFDLEYYDGNILAIDIQLDTIDSLVETPGIVIHPDSLVYVIYTSGSTGIPKGCAITNSNVSNYIQWANSYYFKGASKINFGLYTSLSFDLTVTSIFCSLTRGGKLFIYSQHEELSEILLHSFSRESGIDSIKLTPSHINALQHLHIESSMMQRVIVGGEEVTPQHVSILKRINPSIKIYNEYGPTETTVGCIVKLLEEHESVLIGKPISKTLIYILDNEYNICPIGIPGEIYISGAGVARGYLNQEVLTAERFMANAFKAGERMYKTGDLGRWLPDGDIAFMGRKDDQVKIRGYRIELGEISGSVLNYSAVKEAVALVKEDQQGHKDLVLYYVPDKTERENPETENIQWLGAATLRNNIESFLRERLPDYMLPKHYVQLDSLPLTPNGKLDKKALPDPERMSKNIVYVAPRNEPEKELVLTAQEVLRKEKIGIKNNFFELGGDSIKSIQLVSRLKQRGYSLTVQDVLLHPEIGDMAERISIVKRLTDQGIVEGMIPLSPIQHYFFQSSLTDRHQYNQSVLLSSKTQLSEKGLKAILEKIVLYHDALRMVYRETPLGWRQENKGIEQGYSFEVQEGLEESLFAAHCDRIQSSINLEQGPLFKACLFRDSTGDRLLLVAHHLIIDGVSWRILFEDLSILYQQYLSGTSLSLPLKTDSFKYWQEQQIAYSQNEVLQKEEVYWSSIESVEIEPLMRDYPEDSNLMKDVSSKSFLLDEELTKKLLTQCYQAYHTEINDILLTALSLALKNIFDLNKVLINLEGHGRESIGTDTDVTRTIGWFTTMYPVVFDMNYDSNIIRQLIEIKERLHQVPNKGIGYGILRYLAGKDYKLKPEITFNYLGDFGWGLETKQGDQLFEFSGDYHGRENSENMQRNTVLEVLAMVVSGKIRLSINYSIKHYAASTIESLLTSYEQQLKDLIKQLSAEEKMHISPVDLTYKGLSVEQVFELNKDYDIENVYPLSPLQEGMYYHWLSAPDSPVYFEQMSYQLQGDLNTDILEKSYQTLVSRHTILRTFFTQDLGESPLQVVKNLVSSSYEFRNISDNEDYSIEQYRKLDRSRNFDLHTGSQMRLTVLGIGDNRYEFIWSHHHILMDGWCVSILIKEFFQIYYSLIQNKLPELKRAYHYSSYIEWLSRIDKNKSLTYWKNYLSGYDTPSNIPKTTVKEGTPFEMEEHIYTINGSLRQSIKTLCGELGITENTFIQTAWGILLGGYNNTEDVIFGSVVSGRPPELEGVEEMIGLFINTIPTRIRVREEKIIRELLKEVQQSSVECAPYHYIQLAEIQSVNKLGPNLFNQLMVFLNYPVQEMIKQDIEAKNNFGKLSLLSTNVVEQTNFDFMFTVFSGHAITIKFSYNRNLYDGTLIKRLQNYFTQIIEEIIENPAITIGKIKDLTERSRQQLPIKIKDIPSSKITCSEHQKRLWFVDQFEKGYLYEKNPVYHNLPLILKLPEEINIDSFNRSLNKLLKSHGILRTKISTQNGEPFQLINEDIESRIQLHTVENFVEEADLIKKCLERIRQPFDIEKDLLIRFDLINYNSGRSLLLITAHHLVADRKSLRILFNEIINDYKGLSAEAVNTSVLQFAQFSEWQNELYNDLEPLSFYWNKKLKDAPVLYLETDRQRDHIHIFEADLVSRTFTKELSYKVENFCKKRNESHFIFLLTAFKVLLHRYTGSEEIVIGTLCENRVQEGLSNMIGPISNLITLKNKIEKNISFEELFQRVSLDYNSSMEFSGIPFEKVVLEINPEKDMSRTALFDVLIYYEEVKQESIDKEFEIVELNYGLGKYDINLLIKKDTHLGCYLTFNKKYFDRSKIEKLLDHYVSIIENVLETPSQPINEIDYLGSAEKYQLLIAFNDTSAAYPKDKTIVSLFEEQVEKTPDNQAIVFQETELTYKELNERSNQLGAYLREKYKIKANDLIGIKLERSEWMVIAILGILKSGGAYVPVDPNYPQQRIDYMLADSNCKVVIDEQELGSFRKDEKKYVKKNLKSINKPEDLCYVIYTSGTTGNPKGSLIEHKNVVRLFKIDSPLFDFSSADVWTMFHSYCFDFSVWEMYGALLYGGKLIIIPSIIAKDSEAYIDILNKHGVTVLNQTPLSFYNIIKQELEKERSDLQLRYVIFGGDVLSPEKLEGWRNKYPETKLVNMYGITETTVHVTYKEITEEDIERKISNIGKPIPTLSCYILDQNKRLLPVGVSGEMYVSGDGLARGYLNKPELTLEKFVSNPFREGERLYKTGDLGRWLPDGNIEFAGRKDDQVKIRGYRIELGEIENALGGYEGIGSAVVIAKSNAEGENELVAYIIGMEKLNTSDIRSYLTERLPAYMLPGYIIQLDALPLTLNGKVDRKKLPDPEKLGLSADIKYVAPTTETEKKLVLIWQEVLGKQKIGIKDNFFDLGGHSLKATRLASQIHKEFEVRVALKILFTKVILDEQAQLIEQFKKSSFITISPVATGVNYSLSSSQHRLWILSQFEEGNIAYNMPGAYIFEGDLNHAALEYSFATLIERHESLRTIFKEDEQGEIKQFIKLPEEIGFKLVYKDLRKEKRQKSKLEKLVKEGFTKPFNLASGPLLQAGLYQVEDNKWVFMYVMHHIISDGWSMNILINELLLLYNSYVRGEINQLTPLRIQYKDYAAWQQAQLSRENFNDHKEYWLKQFEGEIPVLELPCDNVRPSVKTYNGGLISKRINPRMSKGIKSLGQKQGGTLFMSLLAVVNTLLYRYTGQEDIIIGSPIAGREHIDLEDQIGFYVNTLALRTRFKGEDNYKEILENVKQVTLEAYEHQIYPFDELVNTLHLERNRSRHPLFDVMVVLQNAGMKFTKELENPDKLKVHEYQDGKKLSSKFDLTFNFVEAGEELYASIEYNSDIYNGSTIERLASHLVQLLEAIIKDSDQPISKLEFLDEIEKHQLLVAFNDTAVDYLKDKTPVDLFEEQVKKTPNNIAIVFEENEFTYAELNKKANQFANYLRNNYKIKADDLIGIKLDRSEWMIIALLGVLKSGGTYVPIDPEYPQDRINYMLEDSRCIVLIDEKELENFKKEEKKCSSTNLKQINTLNNLAYVIYTSGSTGFPKGCAITCNNLSNYIQWANDFYFKESTRVNFGLYTSISFDLTVTCIFCSLTRGGKLVIYPQQKDLLEILHHSFNGENGIDCIKLTPSHINVLKHLNITSSTVLCAIVGGEEVTSEHVNILRKINPFVKIYNEYGPTEATVGCVVKELEKNTPILIGKPISKTGIYILNEAQVLCPIGIFGEINISGAGVARYYLNKPELTAEKFVADPFRNGSRMYKTGDLGRWLPDGNIEFIGRKDDQVKIRGYRIELGEIESVLQSFQDIDSAVVTIRSDTKGEKELVAYITSKEILNVSAIRKHLTKLLPVYMLPGHYVQLETLPLTANGKIDKKRLPDPEGIGLPTGVEYIGPHNEIEEKLVLIWQEVLGKEKIGIKDDFFELGGNSLKATKVLAKIHKQFNMKTKLSDLFNKTTIEEIAKDIARKNWAKKGKEEHPAELITDNSFIV